MTNYQDIVDNLKEEKIIELMMTLGAQDYKDTSNAIIFNTICHNAEASDGSMKLYYYKDSHIFYCYSHCGGMSIFKFLRTYYETRNISYDWFTDIYLVVLNCSGFQALDAINTTEGYKSPRERYENHSKKFEYTHFDSGILNCFIDYCHPVWLKDGITPRAMNKFNIKFCPVRNKIIIPHYDINGNLIGIRGRALNQEEIESFGKYMPVQIEKTWYSHPLGFNLYGLNLNKDNIKNTGKCFIFEGEKSVLLGDNLNMPNCCVASCGSNLNKYQINLLLRSCAPREIILCYDKEEEGKPGAYFEKLYNICKKYTNYATISFVYDFDNMLKLKDSPIDLGESIFMELLKKRVKVK